MVGLQQRQVAWGGKVNLDVSRCSLRAKQIADVRGHLGRRQRSRIKGRRTSELEKVADDAFEPVQFTTNDFQP